jgi:hypothetical protein
MGVGGGGRRYVTTPVAIPFHSRLLRPNPNRKYGHREVGFSGGKVSFSTRKADFLAQKAYFFHKKWYLVSFHTFFSNSASKQILKDDLNGFFLLEYLLHGEGR